MNKNRLIDKKQTFQVVIDVGWWKILTRLKSESGASIGELVEEALSNTYGIDKQGNPYKVKP